MKYDEYDLLELFESEPTYLHDDKQIGIAMYSIYDELGVGLVFSFDVYQKTCDFSLSVNKGRHVICRFDVSNVKTFEKHGDVLRIVTDNTNTLGIRFKPYLSVEEIACK